MAAGRELAIGDIDDDGANELIVQVFPTGSDPTEKTGGGVRVLSAPWSGGSIHLLSQVGVVGIRAGEGNNNLGEHIEVVRDVTGDGRTDLVLGGSLTWVFSGLDGMRYPEDADAVDHGRSPFFLAHAGGVVLNRGVVPFPLPANLDTTTSLATSWAGSLDAAFPVDHDHDDDVDVMVYDDPPGSGDRLLLALPTTLDALIDLESASPFTYTGGSLGLPKTADFDGDGFDDLFGSHFEGGVEQVWVATSTWATGAYPAGIETFFEFDDDDRTLWDQAAGDFNGDGHTDLAVAFTKRGEDLVFLGPFSTGTYTRGDADCVHPRSYTTHVKLAAGDLDGDGRDELVVGTNLDNTFGTKAGSVTVHWGGGL